MNKFKRKMGKPVFLSIFTLIAICNTSYGQSKIDKLDELISKFVEYEQFNGSVLVAEKGEIIYKKGFGLANIEWEIPNQADTKYRLASITKQFTAMLIVQLVAENKLALNMPISTYLPDYPKKNGDIITIHHLLTHSSGTPNYTSFPDYRDRMSRSTNPEEIVQLFSDSTLLFTPGEKFDYSNSGYVLLGVIIEKVTGQSYEQVLQEKIFTPLGMNNSGYDHHSAILKNRAAGYYKSGKSYINASYIDMTVAFSAGCIYSTVEDLFLWDQALYTEKLLPKKYLDLLFDTHIPASGEHYGYGWELRKMSKGRSGGLVPTIGHSGSINGFNTLITRIPSDKSSIILLNNTSDAPLYSMTRAIAGILYDTPYDFPKKSTANSLLAVIEKEDLATALALYKEIKDAKDYYLNENEMNLAGYHFLQAGKAEEATALFKLNMEAFPYSSNAYDSYGEALMVLGNKTQAIENYIKSVQLNPGNKNGVKILKALGINTDTLIKKVPIEHLKLL